MNINYSKVDQPDFTQSLFILDTLSKESVPLSTTDNPYRFANMGKQSPIQSALNILNKVALEGTNDQKKLLSGYSSKIKGLNQLIKDHAKLTEKIKAIGLSEKDADSVKGYRVATPKTKFDKLLDIATLVPRVVRVIFATAFTLIFAGILALPIDQFCHLNPKKKVTPFSSSENFTKAQEKSPYQGFDISGVVCFNSPLRGTKILDALKKETMDARYKNMTTNDKWRHELYQDSLKAERNGELNVYTYGSTLDPACYNNAHLLTENPTRQLTVNTESHYDTMISYSAMKFLNQAVHEIDPTGTIPVIQLHGSSAGKFQFTIFRLASGHNRTFATDYAESRFGNHKDTTIKTYAQSAKIDDLFKEIFEVTGQKKAILVGHSMGGLVSLDIARTIRDHKAALKI